jgi:hypothetical protein
MAQRNPWASYEEEREELVGALRAESARRTGHNAAIDYLLAHLESGPPVRQRPGAEPAPRLTTWRGRPNAVTGWD